MLRRAAHALGLVPAAVLCIAALSTAVMYCSNPSDDQPGVPRGDGVYRPLLARGDGHMHFLITRSLVFDHDLDVDDDLARFGDPWHQPPTVTGRKNVMQQIGPSLIWAPLLAAAHGAALVANAFGASIETHGYTAFHQRILFASSVVFAWLAVGLGVLVAFRAMGGRWAASLAGAAVLLGTSLTYYATNMPSYAHAMDAAACAGFLALWALTIGSRRWRRFIALGALLGVAAMVRVQDLAFGVAVAAELVADGAHRPRELPALLARGTLTLAIACVLFVPQLYVWRELYGAWLTTPQGPGQMRYGHPMIAELLFSPRNGWLSNTPIAYLGLVGLVIGAIAGPRLGPRVRLIAIACLLVIAGQAYINAVTYEWWSGASFGQRRLCSVSLAIVVGLAALLRAIHVRLRGRVPAAVQLGGAFVVLGYLVAWNLHWVKQLARGKTAGRDTQPTCCDDAWAPLALVARPIHDAIGNPFELPASAAFAIEHSVDLARYDAAGDAYPFAPPVLAFADGTYHDFTGFWNVGAPGLTPYIIRGFGPPQGGSWDWRWTVRDRADLLVPMLVPEPHHVTVLLAANVAAGHTLDVAISCNGRVVKRVALGRTWTTIAFDTDGALGMTDIGIAAPIAPFQPTTEDHAPSVPPPSWMAGVAVGPMWLQIPRAP
jgi:hypothetical protein